MSTIGTYFMGLSNNISLFCIGYFLAGIGALPSLKIQYSFLNETTSNFVYLFKKIGSTNKDSFGLIILFFLLYQVGNTRMYMGTAV